MTTQKTFSGETRYQYPLDVRDRRELFAAWCEKNPVPLLLMETKAIRLAAAGHKRISTQYLVEWFRYENTIKAEPVPYVDADGDTRAYGINNSDCAALGRWLLEKHPELPIERRRSILDGDAA